MAFLRRDGSGNAVVTQTTNVVAAGDVTIPIAVATGWPTGSKGKFLVVIDPGGVEEKVLILSRSGLTLTLASGADRGVEGTSPAQHSSGVNIRLCVGYTDTDEANNLVSQTLGAVTAKGDSVEASGAGALVKTAVGANGTVKVADSTQPGGINWAAPAGDLAGTYSTPTLALVGPGATGPLGTAGRAPVVTIDAKGRVTGLTDIAITATGVGAVPTGNAAPPVDIQTFTAASSTWTKPTPPAGTAAYKATRVFCVSSGGGGGSGRRGAAATVRGGGGGGAGGTINEFGLETAALGATETVTVDVAGTGGAAVAVDSTNGNPGTIGGNAYFGNWGGAYGTLNMGAAGGGTATGSTGGSAALVPHTSGAGGAGSATGLAGAVGTATGYVQTGLGATGGGAGGGVSAADVASNGGNGGIRYGGGGNNGFLPLGAGGTVGAGQAGAMGAANLTTDPRPGSGAGGGASSITGAAGAGGPGGNWGSGGGGGGASLNGNNSGAGGAGGAGIVVVITW